MKVLAIDFDGVLHKYSEGWKDGTIYDEPIEDALKVIKKLITQYKLIIYTTRPNHKMIKDWLKKYGFPDMEITDRKPRAQAYIDDRAIRFINWMDIKKLFYSSHEVKE